MADKCCSGIYKITIGNWFYYGSTNNFKKRKSDHLRRLKANEHPNPKLQSVYNKYKLFHFEECAYEPDVSKLLELEQLVLDSVKDYSGICNINFTAGCGPSWAGKTHSDVSKDKMRIAATGRKHSQESRTKMSLQRKGTKRSDELVARIAYSNTGKKRSEETKLKISESKKRYWENKKQENSNG